VEGHERDHVPSGRARHGLVAEHLPLHDGSEWGKLTSLDEAKKLLARHIGPRLVRHCGGRVSGGLVAQMVAAPQMRKSKGNEARVQRKKTMRKQSPKPVPDARLKRE
jgi:hypothetical protein